MRKLAAIEREAAHFTIIHIRANARGTRIDSCLRGSDDDDALRDSRRIQDDVQLFCLTGEQVDSMDSLTAKPDAVAFTV
jgi:hypothetical protein